MSILLICHAGDGIGLGHLSRTLVVAKALRDLLAARVHIIIQGEQITWPDLEFFDHKFVPNTAFLGNVIVETVQELHIRLVGFDLYTKLIPLDILQTLTRIRDFGCRIFAIDGLLTYRNQLDLVFIPSLRCDDPLALEAGAPVIYGMDCLLVPDSNRTLPWIPGPNVLVLTGGSDVTGLGDCWPFFLDKGLPSHVKLEWVRGPFARAPKLPKSTRLNWRINHSPTNLQRQMNLANYAITIFGVSFFELLKLGVPTVVFSPYGKKDIPDLKIIKDSQLAVVADDMHDAIEKMTLLMKDDVLANSLSSRALELMSNSGSSRLCDLLKPWIN